MDKEDHRLAPRNEVEKDQIQDGKARLKNLQE